MSPSSTVHDGQNDTKYVTFELLMHAAFMADEIWGLMREPARIKYQCQYTRYQVYIYIYNILRSI